MNLNLIRPKNATEYSLLSITTSCETLTKQTHRKAEETLDFEMTRPRKIFHFDLPIAIEGSWMIGLTSLELKTYFFYIPHENNKFELYTDTFDEFLFTELIDELDEILDISIITTEHLQDDEIGPRIISTYRN